MRSVVFYKILLMLVFSIVLDYNLMPQEYINIDWGGPTTCEYLKDKETFYDRLWHLPEDNSVNIRIFNRDTLTEIINQLEVKMPAKTINKRIRPLLILYLCDGDSILKEYELDLCFYRECGKDTAYFLPIETIGILGNYFEYYKEMLNFTLKEKYYFKGKRDYLFIDFYRKK